MLRLANLVCTSLPPPERPQFVLENYRLTGPTTAYDYVELTREVLNDVEADPDSHSRFSGDAQSYDPREKNRGIPLMDSRMFSSAQTSHQ